MLEINQAIIIRWAIIFLQYCFLLGIYFFIYRIGTLIYRDLSRCSDVLAPEQVIERTAVATDAYLMVLEADESSGLVPGVRIALLETTMIGRNVQHNTIVIQESFVSSEHALIQLFNDQYWISDLNSTNGTMVNGSRIEDETLLKNDDQIKIGSVILRFER